MTLPDPQLTDYVDGTLSEVDRGAVETHLATCATCRQEVALARREREAVGSLPAVAPPPGLSPSSSAKSSKKSSVSSSSGTMMSVIPSAKPLLRV